MARQQAIKKKKNKGKNDEVRVAVDGDGRPSPISITTISLRNSWRSNLCVRLFFYAIECIEMKLTAF